MGVFTIYCCVCGGPSMDLTDWVKDRVAQEPKFVFGGRRMRWLMRSLAITAHGMIKGICDDYGVLEGVGTDSGRLVCVTVCNWVRSGCDLHIQSTGQQQIDGVLIHKLCWDQHLEPLLGSIGSDALFELLCARSNDRCDFGFDQGEIQKNQGQDYELLEGEGWMVSNPVCSGRVDGATSGSIAGLVPGSLHVIPAEVSCLPFCSSFAMLRICLLASDQPAEAHDSLQSTSAFGSITSTLCAAILLFAFSKMNQGAETLSASMQLQEKWRTLCLLSTLKRQIQQGPGRNKQFEILQKMKKYLVVTRDELFGESPFFSKGCAFATINKRAEKLCSFPPPQKNTTLHAYILYLRVHSRAVASYLALSVL